MTATTSFLLTTQWTEQVTLHSGHHEVINEPVPITITCSTDMDYVAELSNSSDHIYLSINCHNDTCAFTFLCEDHPIPKLRLIRHPDNTIQIAPDTETWFQKQNTFWYISGGIMIVGTIDISDPDPKQ